MVLKTFGIILTTTLVLTGCGGGNGSFCGYDAFGDPLFCQVNQPLPPLPPPVASTASFNVTQAMMNIASQQYTFHVSSADSYGNVYTIAYSSSAGQPAPFGSVQASTANVSQTLFENGAAQQTINTTNYFVLSPYQLLGSETTLAGGSEVVNSWQAPPVTGTVGQTFPSLTATLYHDASNAVIDGTLSETIGLSPDTASTALLCLIDSMQLTQAGINDQLNGGTTSNCFRIDPLGNVLGMQITTPIYGMQMLFY